ncbi:MAG: MBL fold metallo-hydrolase [Gemmatimonadota bacterium]|nr:MBL fold metallo-hydrolase [Gemmatimonadota bacterium]
MKVVQIATGPFQENAYLVMDETSAVGALIDPGEDAERLLAAAAAEEVTIQAIWVTHGHVDHVGAIAAVKRATGAPVHLHPLDRPLYDSAVQHGLLFGVRIETPPAPDRDLADGEMLELSSLRFTVMHAPGHAPGHVVLHGHGVAFVGDCLFAGSVGRTDLPLANPAHLARTLAAIAELPDSTIVYPGHGPATTIGEEKHSNPFLNGAARIVGSW